MNSQYFSSVFFDVDSTLVTIEGLDWLAEQKGIAEDVKKLTDASMNGSVLLEDVFGKKIDMLRPSKNDLILLGEKYVESLSEDAVEVIHAFLDTGKDIYLVTGNFYPAVEVLARRLSIKPQNIIANTVFFKHCGCYDSLDTSSKLIKQDGKALAIQELQQTCTAFIGDSVTDLATKASVDLFIGYGGAVKREKVKQDAEIFLKSPSLSPLLFLLLTGEERKKLSEKYLSILDKASACQ